MKTLDSKQLRAALNAAAEAIEGKKDWLCELDGAIGDADHGVTMSVGFNAVAKDLEQLADDATPTEVFNQAAKSFLNAMGGSAGPLFATAFMRAGAAVKGKDSIDGAAMADAIAGMGDGIAMRGKAEAGEKTMLDAWLPAKQAALEASQAGADLATSMAKIAEAAATGADATVAMQSAKGRSSRLGERSVGHMDPGAASTMVILAALAKFVSKQSD